MALGLQKSSPLSISKFADVNYIIVFTPQAVKNFDGNNTELASTREPTLQRWRDQYMGLWWIPLLPTNQVLTNVYHNSSHKKQDKNTKEVINSLINYRAQNKLSSITI